MGGVGSWRPTHYRSCGAISPLANTAGWRDATPLIARARPIAGVASIAAERRVLGKLALGDSQADSTVGQDVPSAIIAGLNEAADSLSHKLSPVAQMSGSTREGRRHSRFAIAAPFYC